MQLCSENELNIGYHIFVKFSLFSIYVINLLCGIDSSIYVYFSWTM